MSIQSVVQCERDCSTNAHRPHRRAAAPRASDTRRQTVRRSDRPTDRLQPSANRELGHSKRRVHSAANTSPTKERAGRTSTPTRRKPARMSWQPSPTRMKTVGPGGAEVGHPERSWPKPASAASTATSSRPAAEAQSWAAEGGVGADGSKQAVARAKVARCCAAEQPSSWRRPASNCRRCRAESSS